MEIHYQGVGEASMVHAEILGCSYYSEKTVVPVTWDFFGYRESSGKERAVLNRRSEY